MSKSTFRTLLILVWLLTLAEHALRPFDGAADASLAASASPAPDVRASALHVWLLFVFGYAYLILFVVSTVGLFLFRGWARRLYVLVFALGFAYALLPPLTVYTRQSVFIGTLYSLTTILVLAASFFPPLGEHFGRTRAGALR